MRSGGTWPKRFVWSLSLSIAVVSLASAQPWRGGSTLGVSVKSAKGAPVDGALVTIAYRDVGFGDGPRSRQTDNQGEANFTGISLGTWSLKIDHPDHLSYMATVVVRKGKKPQVLTEFLEATGSGRLTMRVKLLKGLAEERGIPVEPVRSAEKPAEPVVQARKDEPIETPKPEPVARPQPERVPRVSQAPPPAEETLAAADVGKRSDASSARPESEDVAAPIAGQPSPSQLETQEPEMRKTDPVSPAEPEEPTRPSTQPEPEAPLEAPSAKAPATVAQTSELEERSLELSAVETSSPSPEAPGIDPQPAIAPASATAADLNRPLPPDLSSLRSYGKRTCFECKPGEWSVAASVVADVAGEASCTADQRRIEERMRSFVVARNDRISGYVGPLPAADTDLPPDTRELLSGACRLVAIVLPEGARFTGYRFQASDDSDGGDCLADQECAIGSARWLFDPGIARSAGPTVGFSVFDNRSESDPRTATLIGYFVPPGGWAGTLSTTR